MNFANLNGDTYVMNGAADSVVIRHYVAGIKGGVTLDVTGFPNEVIKAGHVVIYDTIADVYKPMPIEGAVYAALPEHCEYAGVVVCTKQTKAAMVGVMYAGEVNDIASPYPVEDIKEAMKVALPQLVFMHD